MKSISICYFARVPDIELFNRIDFYSNDIKILRKLGYKVILCNDYFNLPDCDLYFVWWWSSGIIPLLKAKLKKRPVIMIGNIHFSDPSKQGYKYRPFYIKMFIKFSLKYSDIQIATSKIELEDLKNFQTKNPNLVYHAIDEEKYRYSDRRRENIILTVTRLIKLNIERKKVLEIIEAFSIFLNEFPDYKLYIVGRKEDDGYGMVEEKIERLKLSNKVIMTGSITDEEKIELYQKSKVYVQPTSYEGFGMAIAESMLCGTPVVTSLNGAVSEVTGDYAVFVNPDDPVSIFNGIKKLVTDEKLYGEIREKGYHRIRDNFSFKKRTEEIDKLIKSLI
ncbi:MAG: Glycosyltransferase Gtf1 [Ignavibacteria bacterium]|nr:Glycosyltransferase Gtf1 [Ignavibacteria bacterium]